MDERRHATHDAPPGGSAGDDGWLALLDTIPTLVWSAAADGSADFANRPWLDYTGLSAEDATGWGWTVAVHPDDRPSMMRAWQQMLASGAPGEAEARLRRADGQYRWFLFRCVPRKNAAGEVTGWCGTNTDIEDRKRIEQDVARSKQILDETQRLTRCGSMGFDTATGTVFWSDEGARIFGFEPGERPPIERVWERIHPDDRWLSERSVERARRGEPDTEYEVRLVMDDGSIRRVRRIDPLGAPESESGVCALVDVTGAREAEAALQEAQAELARMSRVTSLGELAASITHEVLQPISAIVANGEASLAFLDRPQPDVAEVRDGLTSMVADARRAAEIVGRMRALSKRAKPERCDVDLNHMLEDAVALIHAELVRRAVSLHLELERPLPDVSCDRVQVQQVVINLLLNGIQAMAAVETARMLALRSKRLGDDQVVVEVEDRGTGVDPAVGDRVFAPFFTTKSDGMGMGLAICRSIVRAHGGRLWFTPAEVGTVFCFSLPLA
jgi:PAS domain S-box-containing protein